MGVEREEIVEEAAKRAVAADAAGAVDEVEVAETERQEIDSVAVVDSPSRVMGSVDSLVSVVGYLLVVVAAAAIVRDPADYYSIAVEDPADEVID